MRLPRRAPATAAAGALLAAALTGCTSRPESAVTDVVIGADLHAASATDAAHARALQLRIDQLNASGLMGGRRLVLRVLDNRGETATSLRNFQTFANDTDVAAVVAGRCSECVVGAAQTIEDRKLPTISLAAADRVSNPAAERRHLFKIGANSRDTSAATVGAMRADGVRSIGVLHTDDLYGNEAHAALRAEARKAGIRIVASGTTGRDATTDLSPALGPVLAAKPDALALVIGPELSGLAATDARQARFTGRLYYDAGAAGDMFIAHEAAAASEDARMVFTRTLAADDVIATSPAKATRKQWFRDYTSRYGSYSGVAALAGDAAGVLGEAIARSGANRAAIRDTVESTQVDGLSGAIRITPDNHSGLTPQALTVLVARGGRWRVAA